MIVQLNYIEQEPVEEGAEDEEEAPPKKLTLADEIYIHAGLLPLLKFREKESFEMLEKSPFEIVEG